MCVRVNTVSLKVSAERLKGQTHPTEDACMHVCVLKDLYTVTSCVYSP